jgi:hypothetical protein
MKLPAAQAPPTAPSFPEIEDIDPPLSIFPYPLWVVILASVAVVAAIALLVWWWRKTHPKPEPTAPTAAEIARRDLDRARQRIGSLDAHAFSILVSDILRGYVSRRYELPVTRQTSPEFLADDRTRLKLTAGEKDLLEDFLTACDVLKFAPVTGSADDSSRLIEQAAGFVESTETTA